MIGSRIRDAVTGEVVFDSTTPTVRLLGSYTIAGTDSTQSTGTINVPGFASGTPWVALCQGGAAPKSYLHQAEVSVSGTTINWTSGQYDAYLLYGAYAGTTAGKTGSGLIGVRFVNGNNATQIDSQYKAFAYVKKQSVSIASGGSVQITYSGGYPIIAFRGTGTVCVAGLSLSGGTWTVTIYGGYGTGASGTLYIFDSVTNATAVSSSNIGRIIRNPATGEVTFDSRKRYMKINRVASNSAARSFPASPQTETLGYDNLAFVGNLPGNWWNQIDQSTVDSSGAFSGIQTSYISYMCGGGVNGTTLTLQSFSGLQEDSAAINPADSDTQYTLIDVSGL